MTDHKALLSVMTGNEFATDRLNRMSAELMEYDLHLCYRPGKLLDLADLISRGMVEEEPETRKKNGTGADMNGEQDRNSKVCKSRRRGQQSQRS